MMAAARRHPSSEQLFSPNDIARLFQLVSDIADRRDLDPSEVIDRLEHGLATLADPIQLTPRDLDLFFAGDRRGR